MHTSLRLGVPTTGVPVAWPWSPLSGRGAVLVDECAAGGVSLDRVGRTNHRNVCGRRRSLSERTTRAMLALVLHVVLQ